jgi:hypothetical protein
MATSTSVDKAVDDLLTCTICLETLEVPKYLPCHHTFCETCIHTHITSPVKGDKWTGFKCPICCRLVSFEENGGNPETWSKHFDSSMKEQSDFLVIVWTMSLGFLHFLRTTQVGNISDIWSLSIYLPLQTTWYVYECTFHRTYEDTVDISAL